MAKLPDGVKDRGQLYVVAREVLLDGLQALSAQLDAVTVIGAQAVYLRSADVDLTVPLYTSDADLSLDPALLTDNPPLIQDSMTGAGFVRKDQPGQWYTSRDVGGVVTDIAVDLLVPQAVAGNPKHRTANIPPHAKGTARQVDGIEAALVDADVMTIASLPQVLEVDRRSLSARVAGPAALLIAKAYKIAQRSAELAGRRLVNKDAGDVVRLMMATDLADVAARLKTLQADQRAAEVTRQGLTHLHELFGGARTLGTQIAAEALAGDPIEDEISAIAVTFMQALPGQPD